MLRWSVLVLSLLVNLPMLWQGLIEQQVPIEHVLIRFLITVPIIAVLLFSLRTALHPAKQPGDEADDRSRAG